MIHLRANANFEENPSINNFDGKVRLKVGQTDDRRSEKHMNGH